MGNFIMFLINPKKIKYVSLLFLIIYLRIKDINITFHDINFLQEVNLPLMKLQDEPFLDNSGNIQPSKEENLTVGFSTNTSSEIPENHNQNIMVNSHTLCSSFVLMYGNNLTLLFFLWKTTHIVETQISKIIR